MSSIQELKDITGRVNALIKQYHQLKTQAQNWEHLYKEATDVQKKLIEQSTGNAKLNDSLNAEIAKLKSGNTVWEQKFKALDEKHLNMLAENEKLNTQLQAGHQELHPCLL